MFNTSWYVIILKLAQATTWQNWIKWTEQREKLVFKR